MATSSCARPIRVLAVDDHLLMQEGIASVVGTQPDMVLVARAHSGEEAVAQFARHLPDITLMDLRLPAMSGTEAIREIRHLQPDARVIVLTIYQGDEDIYRAMEAGARAYLLKDTLSDRLICTIRDVHAGRRVVPPDIATALERRALRPPLTRREQQVLERLAKGQRNKEIAAALRIGVDTANDHLKSIFSKLGVHDRTAALVEALRTGLIHLD
ncbi:MAG TPA: response regulator transcription factor [Vicinamibacterales bacterium]|nr:response regulator transcription factor [Vicinamibacterales bacterium]